MKLIVGLGNPGNQYSENRHNVGFMCVNRLAKDIGAEFSKKEGLARTAHGRIDTTEVVLARPQTFMNASGEAVLKLVVKYRVKPADLIVIHDDIDLRLGQIRIRRGGGAAGHHGIESIMDELDNEDFIRVRVGTGRPVPENPEEKRAAVVGFVLEDFSAAESKLMAETIARVSQAVQTIVRGGLETSMNQFNRAPEAKGKDKPGGAKPPDSESTPCPPEV